MSVDIYGFCKIETYDYDLSKGSLLIIGDKTRADYISHRIGVYMAVKDNIEFEYLNNIENIPVNGSTDSLQIRPKIVHVNSKGYFIKEKKGVNYLSDSTVASMKVVFNFKVIP